MNIFKLLLVLLLCVSALSYAQSVKLLNGLSMEESADTAVEKIKAISDKAEWLVVDPPVFPLARDNEAHLVCEGVQTANGTLEQVVFTFADDKLAYIEAHGNTEEVFTAKRTDTAMTYMEYAVYWNDKLLVHAAKDKAWLLTEGGLHANLFTWENPYMNPGYEPEGVIQQEIPSFLTMGGKLGELQPVLENNSLFVQEETLDGSDPNAQLQLNCFGVDYMGFPRKLEARFGDDKLNVVWILTGKGEEDRIRKSLLAQYGDPVFTNADWEIYNNWTVGLRKDKPEVLLMEQEIGLQYKTEYFKQ